MRDIVQDVTESVTYSEEMRKAVGFVELELIVLLKYFTNEEKGWIVEARTTNGISNSHKFGNNEKKADDYFEELCSDYDLAERGVYTLLK